MCRDGKTFSNELMKREIRPMKPFSIMIATLCVGVAGLLLAPMVSGQQTRVGIGSAPSESAGTAAAPVSAIPDAKFQKKDKNRNLLELSIML